MHTCPLLRAMPDPHKAAAYRRSRPTPASAGAHRGLALTVSLAGWLGWRALQDLLNAIPDSNEDFGLF